MSKEERQEKLLRLAIAQLRKLNGISGIKNTIHYDGADCDLDCLADDLEEVFGIEEN